MDFQSPSELNQEECGKSDVNFVCCGATKTPGTTESERLATLRHDLRSAIGAISSCADILLGSSLDGPICGQNRTWIEFIKRSAETALVLTTDI